ncbi:transmembrane protein 127-like [Watersipora subatra]|uniref:transmembrane protein 127-like n=1 Tax=Watersipora subatra TaxID=2589382 RepID=UPI00355AE268
MPSSQSGSSHGRGSRSRSGERTRSRSRNGRRRDSSRRHRRHRRDFPKIPERNFVGAACSMFAIVGACTALAKSEMLHFEGGSCQNGIGVYQSKIEISKFFYTGYFVNSTTYHYGSAALSHNLINCVTPELVSVLKSVLSLVVVSIACMLAAFVLDILGPKQRHVMVVRRNGTLNIAAVIILATVCGLCYWAATLLEDNLREHKRARGSRVVIYFGVSYYVLICSAVINIVATACNLLRKYPPTRRREDTQPILNEVDQALLREELSTPQTVMVREPPPYAP